MTPRDMEVHTMFKEISNFNIEVRLKAGPSGYNESGNVEIVRTLRGEMTWQEAATQTCSP